MAATTTSAEVTCMYKLPPINAARDDLTLPDCMYKLPSLYPKEAQSSEPLPTMDNPEMEKLAKRQKNILSELELLKSEVKGLCTKLNHKFGEGGSPNATKGGAISQTTSKSVPVQLPSLPDGIHDFVISLSPQKLCVSPLLLSCVLRSRGMDVTTPSHKHSSLKEDIPSGWKNATGGINGSLMGGRKKVMFTHIWKADPFCPFVMYAPGQQTRIYGDVNIARYLVRTLAPDLYSARGLESVSEIDQWLEVANQLQNGNNKEKEAGMKALNSHLGRNTYLVDGCLTLADIACLAALLANPTSFTSLAKNVKKWFQSMSEEFSSVVTPLTVPEETSGSISTPLDTHVQLPNLPDGVHDYVISLSPDRLALSPLLLGCILKNRGVDVKTPAHKHSSLKEEIPVAWSGMTGGTNGSLVEGRGKVLLTFIWKADDSNPSVMYSPKEQEKIFGDVKIAKYLADKLSADLYSSRDTQTRKEIDKWIEVANMLNTGNKKEKEAAMSTLNEHLAKTTFLATGSRTLADVVCLAAILANQNSFPSLAKHVKSWLKVVSKEFSSILSGSCLPAAWTS